MSLSHSLHLFTPPSSFSPSYSHTHLPTSTNLPFLRLSDRRFPSIRVSSSSELLLDDNNGARPGFPPPSSDLTSIEVDAVTEAELKENGFRSTRRTKLVCTVGPATCGFEQLEALAVGGMNVARINMCHGTREWHKNVIDRVRRLNHEKGFAVAIMMDTEGSEIHMGDLGGASSAKADDGEIWTFSVRSFDSGLPQRTINVNYEGFAEDVKVGDELLVDGGMVRFEVIEKIGPDVKCRCTDPGLLLPRANLTFWRNGSLVRERNAMLPTISSKDWLDIDFGISEGVDFIAISFVKSAEVITHLKSYIAARSRDREEAALSVCEDLMESSKVRLWDSLLALNENTTDSLHDAHTLLSGVLTNHVTCLDGLEGSTRPLLESLLHALISTAETCLAMIVPLVPKILNHHLQPLNGTYPAWLKLDDKTLLDSSVADIKGNANVVVAQDGSGNFKTLTEAVASVPDNSNARYVIYIKKGTYMENVVFGMTKKNVMLVGDGMDATLITGSWNQVDGKSILQSATVASDGAGFIAQDIWFQNTAGPGKGQAVALRVNGDRSVINRCKIDGYQDTLFAQGGTQFYRNA